MLQQFAYWARYDGLMVVMLAAGVVLLTRFIRWSADLMTIASEQRDERTREGGLVPTEQSKHERALIQVVSWSFIFLLYFVAGLLILERLGIPLTSLVAPATVAGVAIGFGAQRVVQDVLSGFFLFAERQFGYGDVVRIAPPGDTAGISGVVEELTLRTTKLRTIDGELIVIPNGEIRQVTNLSKDWARVVLDIPLAADADVTRAYELLHVIGREMTADDAWADLLLDQPSVMGVESLRAGILHIRFVARTLPGKQWEVGRELRGRVAASFREAGMTMPLPFLTSEPTA
jgi:moderate conductance mechanosensitive channel